MFGSFIKEKRQEKNYSQKDLAELLFITESAVSKWERGITYPDITLIHDICRVLDITEHELIESTNDVNYRKMKKDAHKFNKLKKILFWIMNISYILGILVCFIVNIACFHTLSWFFIVLSSILVAYSFCPTLTWIYPKYKLVIFSITTYVSLVILFLTCSIYFSNYWFMIASISVLLGYFIVLFPIMFKKQKGYLEIDKYKFLSKFFLLIYSGGIFIITLLLLVSIYCYTKFNLLMGILILLTVFIIPIFLGLLKGFNVKNNIILIIILIIITLIIIFIVLNTILSVIHNSSKENKSIKINEVTKEIVVDCDIYNINLYLSKENVIYFDEYKKIKIDIKEENESIYIKEIDNRNIFETLFNNFNRPSIDIYLTNDMISSLDINVSTGDIKVNKGFNFDNIKVKNSTGNILLSCNVDNKLEVENRTGNIIINNSTILGNTIINSKTGKIDVYNVNTASIKIETKTGNTKLLNTIINNSIYLTASTGNVILEDVDAGDIYVKVTTGNIEGTLLSEKIFSVESSTGKINVPESYTGGRCKLITSTGNINIKYKEK